MEPRKKFIVTEKKCYRCYYLSFIPLLDISVIKVVSKMAHILRLVHHCQLKNHPMRNVRKVYSNIFDQINFYNLIYPVNLLYILILFNYLICVNGLTSRILCTTSLTVCHSTWK